MALHRNTWYGQSTVWNIILQEKFGGTERKFCGRGLAVPSQNRFETGSVSVIERD